MSQSTIKLKPNVDLGILVGLLLTDGCVSHRQLIFHNKSEEMHRLFKEKISAIFGPRKITEGLEKNGVKRTQVSSRQIVQKLLEFCTLQTFRRKQFKSGKFPNVQLPSFIKELTRADLCSVLKVIFSADGSISLSVRWHKRNKGWEIRRCIELSCKHPILKEQHTELLKIIGLSPVILRNGIRIEKKNDIIKFKEEIDFLKKVKVGGDSKNWEGFEKNQILDLAIKTFKFKKKDLQQFKTKEEIISFLKSLL